jgi:hypothetical protein
VPLGQRAEGREFVPDAAEQAAIERIRALHAEGRSLCDIIAVLDAEGHRTKQRWGCGTAPAAVGGSCRSASCNRR